MATELVRPGVFGTEMSRYERFHIRSHLLGMPEDDRGQMCSLNDYFKKFNDILNDNYYDNKFPDSGQCFETIHDFFTFFNINLRRNIINKLSYNDLLDNEEKTGIKCLLMSIDIFNLMIDQAKDVNLQTLLKDLFGYFSVFHHYSKSSGDALTITEGILTCLCKCCGRTNFQDQIFDLIFFNQINLEWSFIDRQSSEKIKVAVAIFFCLCGTINKGLREEARAYLIRVSKNGNFDNLGIDKELVQAALNGEERVKEQMKQWKADNLKLNEYFKELNEDYVKKFKDYNEKMIKDILRIIGEDIVLTGRKGNKKQKEKLDKKLHKCFEKVNEDIRKLNESRDKKFYDCIKKIEEDHNGKINKDVKNNEQIPITSTKPNESIAEGDRGNEGSKEISPRTDTSKTLSCRMSKGDIKAEQVTQSNKRDILDLLNKCYAEVKDIFDKWNSEMVEKHASFLRTTSRFLNFYNSDIRQNVQEKLAKRESFGEIEKIGMNCLCVCINIINLNMDRIGEMTIYDLFDLLGDFRQYSQSNAVARRMTEAILYCLCNYCYSMSRCGDKRILLTDENKESLKECFTDPPSSNKIKLAAAIIICFFGSIDDQLVHTKVYLRTVSETCTEKYLGIEKQLIIKFLDP